MHVDKIDDGNKTQKLQFVSMSGRDLVNENGFVFFLDFKPLPCDGC